MSLRELKPCPFCGGNADKTIDDYGEGKFYVTVYCSKCGAKVFYKGAIGTAVKQAVNAWNNRADDSKSAFDNASWEQLLLLFLLSFMESPRHEIMINAQVNGKSVNITYDPHDPEAVQAAETWRNSMFSGVTQFKAVEPVAVKVGDIAPFGDEYRRQKDELKKASAPLVEYLKRHGDPHTTITVTRDSAAERQDERGVTFDSEKPAETLKRGHWAEVDRPCGGYVCSVCGGACCYYGYNGKLGKSRYCPNCGARMEDVT